MEIENYIAALTKIDGYLWEVIGALKAESTKKMLATVLMQALTGGNVRSKE